VKRIFLAPLRGYQRWISPGRPRRCRYEPTCSAYGAQAIRELGPVRGTIVATWRLARCNPFSKGGLDPLSERTLFRDRDCGHDHADALHDGGAHA
jgi:putative membrane protein insertion efficiency factor